MSSLSAPEEGRSKSALAPKIRASRTSAQPKSGQRGILSPGRKTKTSAVVVVIGNSNFLPALSAVRRAAAAVALGRR